MDNKIFTSDYISELVGAHSLYCEYAPTDWRDGLILGNGDIGAIAYAHSCYRFYSICNRNGTYDRNKDHKTCRRSSKGMYGKRSSVPYSER